MPEPTKVIRVDLSEEEALLVIKSINIGQAQSMGRLEDQMETALSLRAFIQEPVEGRLERLNAFKIRFAKLVVGEHLVDGILADQEAEGKAKGYKQCPDCGGYHA